MTPEPKIIGHPINFGKGLVALFKRGCWEIPEIMGASALGLVGIALGITGVMNYYKDNGDSREFRNAYTIVRKGDPRACSFKNPVCSKF